MLMHAHHCHGNNNYNGNNCVQPNQHILLSIGDSAIIVCSVRCRWRHLPVTMWRGSLERILVDICLVDLVDDRVAQFQHHLQQLLFPGVQRQ